MAHARQPAARHARGLPLLPGPRGDGCLPLVDDFLASIPSESRRFAEIQHAKARIHAWLAVQEEPGKPLGQAITARYLDTETIAASEFLAWLRKALVE